MAVNRINQINQVTVIAPRFPQSFQGPRGFTGPGVPDGGSANQILRKVSGADQDTGWASASDLSLLQTSDIGSTVQAFDAGLQSIAGLTTSANQGIYTTGADTYDTFSLTAAGRALLDDADAAAQRTTLGVPGLASNNTFTGDNAFTSAANAFAGDGAGLTNLSRLALDVAPNPQSFLGSIGQNEMQAAAGIGPRRILINTNGTHIIDAQNYAPAMHFVLLPAAGSATLDCSALVQDAQYEFVSGTGGTTCTLDFGEVIFVRSPHVGAGITTVRSIDLPPNQRVTVIRLSGNQVFVDFGSPRYQEGTWLPTVFGSTGAGTQGYALRNGRWMLNGGWLSFTGYIVLNATSGATGNVHIGIDALPFPPAHAANEFYSVSIPYWLGLTSEVSGGTTFGGADHIEVYRSAGGSSTNLPASELTSTTRFRFSGSYPI